MFKKSNREKSIDELTTLDNREIKRKKQEVYHLYKTYYEKILNKQINAYSQDGKVYKITDTNKDDSENNFYITIMDVNGVKRSISIDIDDIADDNYLKHTPLNWHLHYYWNKFIYKISNIVVNKKYKSEINHIIYNSIDTSFNDTSKEKCPKEFNNEINNILYNARSINSLPNEKESLKDKIKWFGHNLFHCKCSDKDESCDVDIDEIIKNNSLEQIEKDKKALYNNPNWDRNNLILYRSRK